MSVLSDEQYRQMARDAGLDLEPTRNMLVGVRGQHAQLINFARAVADAAIAADRAARAEPVAWVIHWNNDPEDIVTSMHNDDLQQALGAGWPIQYLYTAPPAAPVIPRCFMTAESGSGGYRLVMKFQSLVDLHKAHDAMIAMLAAYPAPSQEPDPVAAAVNAERERIYALIDANPERIWRDAGFMQWRAARAKEQQQ